MIDDIDNKLVGNKMVKQKNGLSGGFQKPLTSHSSQLIADQIRGNYKLLMSIVEERDVPLLMNDTIFNKVVNDCKRYLQ